MRRADRIIEFEALDEPERYFHLRERLKGIMAERETLEETVERLQRENQEANRAREQEAERARQAEEQLARIPRNARQYMHPPLRVPASPIVFPDAPANFEIKTSFIAMVKKIQFSGKPTECPMEHVREFLDICDTIAHGDTLEYVRLKAFRWSLAGKALHWLDSLPTQTITTWEQLHDSFLTKFFPPSKT